MNSGSSETYLSKILETCTRGKRVKVAVCTLNQWAMDFETNKNNILESLEIARANGCRVRVGPELEIPGYGCEDHFLELDTVEHSWQVLGEILLSGLTQGMICDFGMPVVHKGSLYNCRVVCLDGKVLLVRPKVMLADNGNYREPRWFTAWRGTREDSVEECTLPDFIQFLTGQKAVPFGNLVIQSRDDVQIGYEICEEMWVPQNQSTRLFLDGVDIVINPSGSHYERLKQKRRTNLITDCTSKTGGIYLYSNVRGCDGGRVYYDGNSIVAQNGKILEMSDMFSLKEVDVIVREVDVQQVRQFRVASKSFGAQATSGSLFPRVRAELEVFAEGGQTAKDGYLREEDWLLVPESEISWGPSCYLWDYLKRSGAMGYFLPLSGGADSAATALIVFNMCRIVHSAVTEQKDEKVLRQLRKIVREEDFTPKSPAEICGRLLFTAYMASENSSSETRERAELLAQEIGCKHYNLNITDVCGQYEKLAGEVFQRPIRYEQQGGTPAEDLQLQNIQARSRMILAYLMGGLIPQQLNKKGFLLVLGSANLDEGLRGYMTKYDCSSADINPIGSISKMDLKKFLEWNAKQGIMSAKQVLEARPTAELRPLGEGQQIQQNDEDDMGLTYKELQEFGVLRKNHLLGPFSMFQKLLTEWHPMKAELVAEKVKRFFFFYAVNRHKQTTITPAYHAESYSIDDNRFDLRQFLYNPQWTFQFKLIDQYLSKIQK